MQPLSVTDAIGPAFTRMRRVLFEDFRLRTFLKIALVAAFTDFSISTYGNWGGHTSHGAGWPPPGMPPIGLHQIVMLVIFGLIVLIPFSIFLTWLISHLKFVVFDVVLTLDRTISNGWRRTSVAANRFFGLMLVLLLASMALLLILFLPFVTAFIHIARYGMQPGLLPRLAGFAVIAVMFSIMFSLARAMLHTVVIPRMALAGESISEALQSALDFIRSYPGPFIGFVLLRFFISIGMFIALLIVAGVAFVIALLPLGAAGFAAYHFLWHSGPGGMALCVCLFVVLGMVAIALYFCSIFSVLGVVNVFREAYALFFYGGYYPALGNMLEPPAAPFRTEFVAPAIEPPTDIPPQAIW
jgi:hypothetical protein